MLVFLAVTSEIAGTVKFFDSHVPKVSPADTPSPYFPTFLRNPATADWRLAVVFQIICVLSERRDGDCVRMKSLWRPEIS
ncbi:hypothetical protein PHO31112_02589 [Pandoraea horticolens]|uniref:Uncharacterized protein n=1 Tax=Pandoraea horticolens TaxID=2508298 RepID=A0A5E4VEM6_9BURK|nr:hypothetical protein [Pandoraea horticolens]VVE10233.1 hypothetical protein PHO31112_02589 [Pandoraea horticolens]